VLFIHYHNNDFHDGKAAFKDLVRAASQKTRLFRQKGASMNTRP
jgi:hypothetical protein